MAAKWGFLRTEAQQANCLMIVGYAYLVLNLPQALF